MDGTHQINELNHSKSPSKRSSHSHISHHRYNKSLSRNSSYHEGEHNILHNDDNFSSNPLIKPKGPDLDFLIVLSNKLEAPLTEKGILNKISGLIGGISMEFDQNFSIPEYNGSLLKVKGASLKKKRDATQQLLEFILENDLDQPENAERKFVKIQIVIMIPNGLVSMVIGTRGKQISTLIHESNASIVINQPIYKMTYRTVSISGRPKNVSDAIMSIQQIMEERYNEVSKIEFECKPLNVKTTTTNVKFVMDEKVVDYLSENKNINFFEMLQRQYNVTLKITKDWRTRSYERKEYICSFQGTIQQVQGGIIEITRYIKNLIKSIYDDKKTYTLRMLINKVFVTKLIGARGCMIQEIANFSKGASIKIMSNKYDEKKSSCHDIPVCICGSFSSVQDATCIIIEQMECFKNGGPVLKSGKSLHQNIANQFVNSIFTSASATEKEEDFIYTLSDGYLNRKVSRNEQLENNPNEENNREQTLPYLQKQEQNNNHSEHSKSPSPHDNNKPRVYSKSSSKDRKSNSEESNSKSDDDKSYQKNVLKNINDYTTNFSYEDNGVTKISTDFIVPDHLVSLLIGKKGENVRTIMSKTGASINFSKEYNDDCKITTSSGTGRICNLKGTPSQNAQAMLMISEMVIKYETKTLMMRKGK